MLFLSLLAAGTAHAENWPGWRGPRGDGTSLETNVPVRWDGNTGENIVWKSPIPGTGHASPIVWNDRVFLVTCLPDSNDRLLMCLDRQTGQIRWQKSVLQGPLETIHPLNSYASSTPATDGNLVYVAFLEVDGSTVDAPNVGRVRPITPGTMLVAAYDFDGNQKWLVKPGPFISAHGYGSSPVLYEDLVIMNGDHDGDSYVVALDKLTGDQVWRIKRRHGIRSYVTPIVRNIEGRTQMVMSGSQCIVSLDPRDGSQLWRIEGPTEQFVASMVYDGQLFFMTSGYPTYHVMGIRPDGSGDVTDSHVVWHATDAKCYVPSPVVVADYLFVADDRGTANCFQASTGRRLWRSRLGNHFSASLLAVGQLVYFLSDSGAMKVVRAGPKLDLVADNDLGESIIASPAVSNSRIYLRGEQHLYCIGQ